MLKNFIIGMLLFGVAKGTGIKKYWDAHGRHFGKVAAGTPGTTEFRWQPVYFGNPKDFVDTNINYWCSEDYPYFCTFTEQNDSTNTEQNDFTNIFSACSERNIVETFTANILFHKKYDSSNGCGREEKSIDISKGSQMKAKCVELKNTLLKNNSIPGERPSKDCHFVNTLEDNPIKDLQESNTETKNSRVSFHSNDDDNEVFDFVDIDDEKIVIETPEEVRERRNLEVKDRVTEKPKEEQLEGGQLKDVKEEEKYYSEYIILCAGIILFVIIYACIHYCFSEEKPSHKNDYEFNSLVVDGYVVDEDGRCYDEEEGCWYQLGKDGQWYLEENEGEAEEDIDWSDDDLDAKEGKKVELNSLIVNDISPLTTNNDGEGEKPSEINMDHPNENEYHIVDTEDEEPSQ